MRTSKEIAADNDVFRNTLISSPRHRLVLSECVSDLQVSEPEKFQDLITALREFNAFTPENNPWGENDFGAITLEGDNRKWFFKFDYFDENDENFELGADPHDGATNLVLTLMESDEY